MNKLLLTCLLGLFMASCTIIDEELIIANGLATVKMVDDRPKVRVATGVDECKWKARIEFHDLNEGDHEVWFLCEVPFKI